MEITSVISIKDYLQNEKLPKNLLERDVSSEKEYGISDFSCAVIKTFNSENIVQLQMNGKYRYKVKKSVIMMIKIYNGNNELIEMNAREAIKGKTQGETVFSVQLQVPNDETISKITIRFALNPVTYY